MTNLDSILKCRDITLSTRVHLVKAMVFPVVMYGCESRTIKKAECWRIDAFELWYWRRFLRVPGPEGRSNKSILKEISPEYSLEGLILRQNLQYFGHLMQRVDSLEKTLILGKIEGRRRRGWQSMRWLDGMTDSKDMGLSKHQEMVKDRDAWRAAVRGITKSGTWLSDWTTATLPKHRSKAYHNQRLFVLPCAKNSMRVLVYDPGEHLVSGWTHPNNNNSKNEHARILLSKAWLCCELLHSII